MDEIGAGAVLADTYELESLLGRGGMGAVWTARHLRLPGKRVAVKLLHGEFAADPSIAARFRREAEIASRLGHPNIVAVLDWNVLPSGTPYLVMELLNGESLAQRLQRGPIALDEAMALVRQIGSALSVAHRAGVVHRDLKPDNLFLTPLDVGGALVDQVKVLDFGISKIRDSSLVQTKEATLLGTPQYMSPEQAEGRQSAIDPRTDQFALGAIAYEMLVGEPAFAGSTLAEVIYKVTLGPTPSLRARRPELPPSVAAAVERALAKDPVARFADVETFVEALTGRPLASVERRLPAAKEIDPLASTAAAGAPSSLTPIEIAATKPAPARTPIVRIAAFVAGPLLVGAALVAALAGHRGGAGVDRAPIAQVARTPPLVANSATNRSPPTLETNKPVAKEDETRSETPKPAVKPAPRRSMHEEPLPPEVEDELSRAEQRLVAGDAGEAIRLARHSLLARPSSRAFAIVARGFCAQGDLGNARAQLAHLSTADRSRVTRACAAAGIPLE